MLTSKSAFHFSMFHVVCSRLRFRANSLLVDWRSTTTTKTVCYLQTPFLSTSKCISLRRFSAVVVDKPTHHKSSSFTVSYLINSCGLSEDKAIAASKKFQFESSINPDSVLNLFRNYELGNTHISKIISKCPSLLLANADKNLKPKLDFFNSSLGLSGPELGNLLSFIPDTFRYSLRNRIEPAISFLKTFLPTQSQVVTVIKRATWLIMHDIQKQLAPNVGILRAHGVPDLNISKLLVLSPRSLANNSRLDDTIKEAKKLKLDPSEKAFTRVISVLSCLSKSTLERKFNIYKSWGWSEDEIRTTLIRHPKCMTISEKNIMDTMEFLVNKMGYDLSMVIRNPYMLTLSLEKRIIPRISVIHVLVSNGIFEKQHNIHTALQLTNDKFLSKFVTKHEERVPGLLNTYNAKMG